MTVLARLLRRLADRLDPPDEVLERARAAGHSSTWPAVVPAGYAQGRADLQLVHDGDALLSAMYRDPGHPLRAAADRARGHGASEGDPTL